MNDDWIMDNVCRKTYFTWRQVRFCRKQFPWMFYTQDAARTSAEECQSALRKHNWNCQSINKAPAYSADLKKGDYFVNWIHSWMRNNPKYFENSFKSRRFWKLLSVVLKCMKSYNIRVWWRRVVVPLVIEIILGTLNPGYASRCK